ncbi:putative enhancer of polycomb protein [Helianthus annuus]|uniref:Enhancer of polycomb-like protein n=1 Tax=Helianthus annuus TaxID=4232 RepID=A0A9K3MYN6_HELAN|nr:uncharacterized protein LOC110889131 isoform X2 [Helianthus annuus]KAF5780023.1 putative enhancer of polycomb protein [Helianthus annuus]KAJ0499918.1 putative enhancer of polycomb protein [Helianthus annuus]KAJ0507217.1 putative enhancer of polycomb protein [Helianthus annuus]KAJ0515760.1 putative enhancer of polycomb protein [Helianthus annuus]KAJ0683767.1 putative enhancer of polycomb protein [Helianthus annuus]
MPSVEMRRTTRVFGARVLRSGRRLFPTQEVGKHMRRPQLAAADVEEDWIGLLDHSGGGFKENVWHNSDDGVLDKEVKLGESKEIDSVKSLESDGDFVTGSRRWGLVYSRKRKRTESSDDLDKKFGKKFFRKQSGKKIVTEDLPPPDISATEPRLSEKSNSRKKKTRGVSASRRMTRNSSSLSSRNSVTIHRGIQKRRSSLRSRKQRNPSSFGNSNAGGGVMKDGEPFYPMKSNTEISKSIRRVSVKDVKELTQDIDSASCNASILVIESDRCHRETGAVITMETSGPNHWFLVVKRNGVERFRVETRNVMRPCFCNRVTHAIIWAGGDESWRLEFPIRQDWLIFKELYKECSERTVRVQDCSASIIPVPQVNEVLGYADEKYVPFKMPDLYIRSRGDEVSRILEKSDPVYEMDSDDDEWLNKYNDGRSSRVDEDAFEKIIDAFERGMYCSPDDYSDVTKAVDRCLMLASKDVLEAVYGYWMARRKAKRSALVPAFELYKPKKHEQLNFKAVLRKKRSFRQRGTQSGRGKQITFLKALHEKTKTDAAEAENITAKVQETKEAANRAEQEAITKRHRAQLLMEVADLLTYKASIAVKIAEALAAPGSGADNAIDELFLPVGNAGFT